LFNKLQRKARDLKNETYAIYLAARDPRTPWYAKTLIFFVVAHTFSPIDLIPDFIPILGYLDDLIITPVGIWLAVRLIPLEVLEEARVTATARSVDRRVTIIGAGITLLIWILAIIWGAIIILRLVEKT
jgi:uncharacterized membrane protein YkvA (DUF1232 family)